MASNTAGTSPGPQWDWADRMRKIRRTVACVSQVEMARLLNVKPPTYGAWEGGRNVPSMRVAYEVAQRIEQLYPGRVSAGWVLGFDPVDTELLLPRMDSNHQPCGWRSHSLKPLHPNPFRPVYATPQA